MKNYLVKISFAIKWPETFEYRIKCSSRGTAASRALSLLQKELKGKRLGSTEITLKIIQL